VGVLLEQHPDPTFPRQDDEVLMHVLNFVTTPGYDLFEEKQAEGEEDGDEDEDEDEYDDDDENEDAEDDEDDDE
jgi:hypothetical protein